MDTACEAAAVPAAGENLLGSHIDDQARILEFRAADKEGLDGKKDSE
jgi:hypothetical protein